MNILKRSILILGVFLMLAFVAFILIAIGEYQGGHVFNAGASGFSLRFNLLTDLGRTTGYNGLENTASQYYYGLAMQALAVGISIIHFIWLLSFKRERSRLWAAASFLLAVLASVHIIGIVGFPADENYPRHFLFLSRTIAAIGLGTLMAYFAIYFEPRYNIAINWLWLVLGLLFMSRWGLLIFGPEPWTNNYILSLHLLIQKVSWIMLPALLIYEAYVVSRITRINSVQSRQAG